MVLRNSCINVSVMSLMVNMENDSGSEADHSFTERSLSSIRSYLLLTSIERGVLLMFDCRANF